MVERRALYLARASYRRRRLIDAARLLPLLMLALWLLPLLWGGGDSGRPVGEGARAVIYVFAIWGVGILASVALSYALTRVVTDAGPTDLPAEADPEPEPQPSAPPGEG